jgi:GTPase SAR1 family protein
MITTFKITDQKAIKLAECDCVPLIMIIFGQNGVGKSTLLHAVKQSIMENVVKNEDVIFVSPLDDSRRKEYAGADAHIDEPFSKIASVLGRLEIIRRNIIATSSLPYTRSSVCSKNPVVIRTVILLTPYYLLPICIVASLIISFTRFISSSLPIGLRMKQLAGNEENISEYTP